MAEKSPAALALAKAIRKHPLLKQRQGLVEPSKKVDFFRFKRAIRALNSDEYKQLQKKSPHLPPVTNDQQATLCFIELIKAGLVYPVHKIDVGEAKSQNLGVEKGFPNLLVQQKANLTPDEYYIWVYEVPNPYAILYGLLFLGVVFGVILFPLWPYKLRLGVWYCSMGCLGLLVGFFIMAIFRLILFCLTFVVIKPGFWLYPNLFADCGFWESFRPLYGWGNEVLDPKTMKLQERKKQKALKAAKKQKKLEAEEEVVEKIEEFSGESKSTGRKVVLEEVEE